MVPIKNPCWLGRNEEKGRVEEKRREKRTNRGRSDEGQREETRRAKGKKREREGEREREREGERGREERERRREWFDSGSPLPVGEREKVKESASRAKRVDSLSSLFYKTRFLLELHPFASRIRACRDSRASPCTLVSSADSI